MDKQVSTSPCKPATISSLRTQIKGESLSKFKARQRKKMEEKKSAELVPDDYEIAEKYGKIIRGSTGVSYDDIMAEHKCEWDPNYPENPQRYSVVVDRCKEMNLLDRCLFIEKDESILDCLHLVHTPTHLRNLTEICKRTIEEMKGVCHLSDSIFINKRTAECASVAAAYTYGLVRAIVTGRIQNGMAIVRPPGHHAMKEQYCGYCFVNNVAVAARTVLSQNLAKRILIVDFDVHHGQGTQQMFYKSNDVLYISIHRYEHGSFWPNLRQSNFDFIGMTGTPGLGYNVNIPLNETGCGDIEYMAILTQIILPLAYEYRPDLVIFSAGYDACMGCPEGMMTVTPAFYGHMMKLLAGVANGRLAVVLEGGYYLPSLAEGAAMTLKALLDDPAALLPAMDKPPAASVTDTINNVASLLRPHWRCFDTFLSVPTVGAMEGGGAGEDTTGEKSVHHTVHVKHEAAPLCSPYEVADCYPIPDPNSAREVFEKIEVMRKVNDNLHMKPVCYAYDDNMLNHIPERKDHPERPERLKAVFDTFTEWDLDKRCQKVNVSSLSLTTITSRLHDANYVSSILNSLPYHPDEYGDVSASNTENEAPSAGTKVCFDIYMSPGTGGAIKTALLSVLAVAEAVIKDEATAGVALIRPPGHHAEHSKATGFCFLNNAALAADYLLNDHSLKRILIVDFDIHHGNGTQRMFYGDARVLYLSIHKFDKGKFYPFSQEADYTYTGDGAGLGYNVNIPFNGGKMTDADYLAVFQRIVLPIAYAFAPQLTFVSAGFDAGVNDTLGNYRVTPQAFAHMVQLLRPLSRGRLVLVMEGGYNVTTLRFAMCLCVKALLGDPLPVLPQQGQINPIAIATIRRVIAVQRQFWPSLEPLCRVLPAAVGDVASVTLGNGVKTERYGRPNGVFLNAGIGNRKWFPEEFAIECYKTEAQKSS